MDAAALRSEFPVLERFAYLNAGTDGPVPAVAADAARAELVAEVEEGRWTAHFERRFELQDELRAFYARVMGCDTGDVALTTSTSEGLGTVLAGLDLGPGDEIVTSDSEHPGLIGPLKAARDRGVTVKEVPFCELADAVSASTTLVACSHVSWVTGEVAPAALADAGVPVVLDGAQGSGAVPVDVRSLNCAAYAAAGQKWLCGADGTGMLYVAPELFERVKPVAPSYTCFAEVSSGLDSPLRADARRFDTPSLAREAVALSVGAARVLEAHGLDDVLARGRELAARLSDELTARGRAVAPRGDTTLVSFEEADPLATRERLARAGVIVRNLPGHPYVRASVGAWNGEEDLDRLLAAL